MSSPARDDATGDNQSERRPLRLLALDGGGIRGFSELKMLHVLMHKIQWDRRLTEPPLPCDYFDLIGGTSTGGIIAVLLGRLRFSVDQCLEIYAALAKEVFGQERRSFWGLWQSRFNHQTLERVIIRVLDKAQPALAPTNGPGQDYAAEQSDATVPGNEMTMLDNHPKACKAFVTATLGRDAQKGNPHLFRTYGVRDTTTTDCKIWEAVRATSAAPTFFDAITIGTEDYVDGGFGCNNPVGWVYQEAKAIWPGREIGCIISLGTGMPKVLSLENLTLKYSRWPKEWLQVLERTATECDTAHQDMVRMKELKGKYFRFNVQQGLQNVSLMEWEKLGETASITEAYLGKIEVEREMNKVVEKLLALDNWVAPEAPSGPTRSNTSGSTLPSYSRANTRDGF